MILTVYLITIVLFCLAFSLTRIVETAIESIDISRQAIKMMSATDLNDLAKEKFVQKAAIRMMKNCGFLVAKGCFTVMVVALFIWLADLTRLASMEEVSQFALRLDVLVVTSVGMTLSAVFLQKLRKVNKI